jgi:serine/threonine protein kinase/GTPase SAR1 family protein
VEKLLKNDPRMAQTETPGNRRRSLLHIAVKSGRVEMCAFLLERGLDANVMSGDQILPIHVCPTVEIWKILIDSGANALSLTGDGRDALSCAVFPEGGTPSKPARPNLEMVTFLLESSLGKADVLEKVTALDLRNLCRDNLPVWIGKLKNLKTFQACEGNALAMIPQNFVDGGDEAVLSYLKDFSSGSKDLWQGFKVLVLGKEGVGKTHIFHRVSGRVYERNISTEGIEIHPVKLSEEVSVTWFDFGGQEVFYPTHELFLTGQCVYLLAFKMNDPDFEQRITYWLNVADSFAFEKAKVVVVGTHLDQLAGTSAVAEAVEARVNALTSNMSSVVACYFVSCLDETLGQTLSEALIVAAGQAGLGKKEVPHVYTVIKEWVEDQKTKNGDQKQPYFTWKQFVECFSGYDHFLLERTCEFLHNNGVLFLGKRRVGSESANLIFIDIQWLAKAFSAVITFRHKWVKDGLLNQEGLFHIWKDFGFVEDGDILSVMRLFEDFNIVFPHRNEGTWIVPSMLSEKAPKFYQKLGTNWSHQRRYSMTVVPTGVFGKLMAKVSSWEEANFVEMWRFGFVLHQGSFLASVTVERGCEIFLRVKRTDATEGKLNLKESSSLLRHLNEELAHSLQFMFRRKEFMPYEQFILCPHCIEHHVPVKSCQWLRFADIISMVLYGHSHFQCGEEDVLLDKMGDDLTLGYVKSFKDKEVAVEKTVLAQGAFGRIYKGTLKGQIPVVVKELIVEGNAEESIFADLQREVSVMSRLRHPNIVQLYGIMLGPLRMVIELCDEGDLLGALRKGGVKTLKLQLRLALDIARGMEVLHSCNPPVAHRDLRSPNVLVVSLNPNETEALAKVGDFGMAAAATSRLKLELLTWQWMAPEAVLGENYLETCDLYSFGIVFWEIMQGKGMIPFQEISEARGGKNVRGLMNEIISKGLRPSCDKKWPEGVVALIEKLWLHDAEARPSFSVCVAFLEELLKRRTAGPALLEKIEGDVKRRIGIERRKTVLLSNASKFQQHVEIFAVEEAPKKVEEKKKPAGGGGWARAQMRGSGSSKRVSGSETMGTEKKLLQMTKRSVSAGNLLQATSPSTFPTARRHVKNVDMRSSAPNVAVEPEPEPEPKGRISSDGPPRRSLPAPPSSRSNRASVPTSFASSHQLATPPRKSLPASPATKPKFRPPSTLAPTPGDYKNRRPPNGNPNVGRKRREKVRFDTRTAPL